jgi:hypothetical protein
MIEECRGIFEWARAGGLGRDRVEIVIVVEIEIEIECRDRVEYRADAKCENILIPSTTCDVVVSPVQSGFFPFWAQTSV